MYLSEIYERSLCAIYSEGTRLETVPVSVLFYFCLFFSGSCQLGLLVNTNKQCRNYVFCHFDVAAFYYTELGWLTVVILQLYMS